MGFDSGRFESGVDEELICLICNGVFDEPLWVPSCQHTFCSACILEWLQHQSMCPVDRNPLSSDQLEKAPRILSVLLGRMKMRCENAVHGCEVIITLDQVLSHRQVCQYNPKRPVECIEGCGLVVPWDELKQHHCVRDLRALVDSLQLQLAQMDSVVAHHKQQLSEMSEEFYQLKVKLKLFDADSILSQLATTQNITSLLPVESEEERFKKWIKCLPLARVHRWGGMISTPDGVLRTLLQRSLVEAGCPTDFIQKLMERSHEKAWPPGLNSLETRQSNHQLFDQFVCKRLPGKQVVIIVHSDNQHMGSSLTAEPAVVFLFAHGVENAL